MVGGTANSGTTYQSDEFAVARYNANGSLDTSFGSRRNGLVITPQFGGNVSDEASALAIQPGGQIVLAGYTTPQSPSRTGALIAVARYTGAGSLDGSFGTGGIVTGLTPSGTTNAYAEGVVVQSSGAIVVAGGAHSTSNVLTLARLTSAGQLDPTFGTSGYAISNAQTHANTLAQDANGDLLAGGNTPPDNNGHPDMAITAFLPGGTPDTTFGTAGTTTAIFTGANSAAYALAIQNDGKIVAAGNGNGTLALARFLPPDTKIGSFSGYSAAGNITLTASNILNSNPTSTINQVNFYLQNPDLSFTLLGTGTNNNGTWTFTFAEATYGLTAGNTYTFVAQAVDSKGALSDPVSVALMAM